MNREKLIKEYKARIEELKEEIRHYRKELVMIRAGFRN